MVSVDVGKINYKDAEYECRSLTPQETANFRFCLKKYAKQFWHPAQDYLKKLGDLPQEQLNYCLASYLATLNWDNPPPEVIREHIDAGVVATLLQVMSPEFPQELVTEESLPELMTLLGPYFVFVETKD